MTSDIPLIRTAFAGQHPDPTLPRTSGWRILGEVLFYIGAVFAVIIIHAI